jgi:hypothetical protein
MNKAKILSKTRNNKMANGRIKKIHKMKYKTVNKLNNKSKKQEQGFTI